ARRDRLFAAARPPGPGPGHRGAAHRARPCLRAAGPGAHRGRRGPAQRAVLAPAGKARLPPRGPAAQPLAGRRRGLRFLPVRPAARGLRRMSLRPSLDEALAALRRGEAIGLPTETVYGLAADAANAAAVRRIF